MVDLTLSWVQWWWFIQLWLVGPSLIYVIIKGGDVESREYRGGAVTNISEQPNTPRSFYNFKKKFHYFYVLGLFWMGWITYNLFESYCTGVECNSSLVRFLSAATAPKRHTTDAMSTLLACVLLLAYYMRRIYESVYVNILSSRHIVNPVDILLAAGCHLATAVSLVAEAPALRAMPACFSASLLRAHHVFGITLYVLASMLQYHSHKRLADLRRNKAGHIVTTGYKKPQGGAFEYVSCPHYTAEILIYFSLAFVLGMHSETWWWAIAYVTCTLFYNAFNVHAWYKKKFDDYPSNRKIIIPFIL